jgi:hypothetical protein
MTFFVVTPDIHIYQLVKKFAIYYRKVKLSLLTGHGGPKGYETSRLAHFLESRLTDGGKPVSLTRRPLFTPQEDSWYSFPLVAGIKQNNYLLSLEAYSPI